jgi:3-hydroxyacyl-CoA dehydrogenase / enoyl-CoA hydratase / 3-hydroxybutyryl-CoA epimerase
MTGQPVSAFSVATDNGIAVVTFDLPGEPVNKLSAAVSGEFEVLLDRLASDGGVRAVVLISGKPDTFIAGADIEEFVQLRTQADAEAMSRDGQETMNRVAAFPKPVVAAIHGACLGGGFELALACHYRIATDSSKTQIGLPEVQLGLVPGAGGTQRLPRLIGARAALDIILAGKSERGQKAFRLGMVDELVPPSILRSVAVAAADRIARQGVPHRESKGGAAGALLDRTPVGRRLVYRQAGKTVLQKTGGHYPAPLAALDAVRVGLEQGMAAGLEEEHRRFGELAVGAVSRKLVQIFFATNALKKDDGVPAGTVESVPAVSRVCVVGSGFMGSGIAGTAVLNAEVEVRLKDAELPRVGRGIKAAIAILDERLQRRRLTRPKHQRLVALVSGAADYSGFTRADLVIEAVFEDLDVKRQVLAEVEREIGPDAIFATNTSTIPISAIAAHALHPGRVLGMHFFSPVAKMPLLEVIPHAGTAPASTVAAVRFGRRMGKTVIVVADRPGFWVNRILMPYLNEAGLLLSEGVPIELIDRTMTRFGFPVGPIALLDEVGLDVGEKAAAVMQGAYGARLAPSPVIAKMVADGRLGRKSGRGFYRYADGRKSGVDPAAYGAIGVRPREGVAPTMVEQRLVYAMLNEAAMAAGEGVIRAPRDGDIGAIYGIGFPPFRGGPLRMIDELGPRRVADMLAELASAYGERFTPAPALTSMAVAGSRFYPD